MTDPLYGLKYIAFCRTGLEDKTVDMQDFINFAKWHICRTRKVLWNDPVWDNYTDDEILIEFFSIRFDESPEVREEFKKTTVSASKSDLDWFEEMERKALAERSTTTPQSNIIKEDNNTIENRTIAENKDLDGFEDTF